jgi:type I restriction-modification system DNA methylase subunit
MATRSAKIDQKADLIWAIADKLTGVYKPHEYGDVILPLTVIRRFDCILSDTKDAVLSGMGRWRLQADKFLNFYIPIPPYDEQKKIADYITDKVNHIEVEIDKRNKLIKKYQEYKKSLIYEVVTGKKEV